MTGADLQWWHFVIALATMLVFVAWDSVRNDIDAVLKMAETVTP